MDFIAFDRTLPIGYSPPDGETKMTFPEAGEGSWSTLQQTSRTPSHRIDQCASKSLEDLVCLVNFAASPGGRLVATGLAAKGAKICLFDADEDGLLKTAEALSSFGCLPSVWALDMSSKEAADVCLRAVFAKFGRIDLLINAVHLTQTTNLQTIDLRTGTSTVLTTHLSASAHVASVLDQSGADGAIINVVFLSADTAHVGPILSPEKNCLDELTTFTLQIASRPRRRQLRVFGICQPIAYGHSHLMPIQMPCNMASSLARLCILLASDVSDHLNGAVLTLRPTVIP